MGMGRLSHSIRASSSRVSVRAYACAEKYTVYTVKPQPLLFTFGGLMSASINVYDLYNIYYIARLGGLLIYVVY